MRSTLDPGSDPHGGWRRLFVAVLVVATAYRAWFAATLPFTGDEAYFYFWGRNPDWGFYDHPPMIGWWLAALLAVSDHPMVLRLPTLLLPPAMAFVTRRALAPHGEAVSYGTATLLLLAPLNAVNVAVTTDTPLIAFSFLAMATYLRALRTTRAIDYLLAGAWIGGALLSKYFAVLLAVAIVGHRLAASRPNRAGGTVVLVAGLLPGLALQFDWNASHCWPNVMFNVVNRHGAADWSWRTPLLYAASLAYAIGVPVLLGLLPRAGSRDRSVWSSAPGGGSVAATRAALPAIRTALAWMTVLPLAAFAALSAVRTIGLHWLAAFVAPATWLFGLRVARDPPARAARRLRAAIGAALAIALLHWVTIVALALAPTERFSAWRSYPGLVLTLHADELIARLEPWRAGWVWAADGYSSATTLGFADRKRRDNRRDRIIVLGTASSHARQDDLLTDFRALDGRDLMLILKGGAPPAGRWEPYFERVEYDWVEVRGVRFHLMRGYGFRYAPYREAVLDPVRRRWYAVPAWLPAGPCYFCDRYFPDRVCRR